MYDPGNFSIPLSVKDLLYVREMKGIEFSVFVAKPDERLFVIQKGFRKNSNLIIPLTYYYILEGNIYECPSLSAIFLTRFNIICESFSEVFSTIHFSHEKSYIVSSSWNFLNHQIAPENFGKTFTNFRFSNIISS